MVELLGANMERQIGGLFWLRGLGFSIFHFPDLWVGGDRDNGYDGNSSLAFVRIRTVVPENAASTRRIVLGVGLKNFESVRPGQRREFMCLKAGCREFTSR